MDVVDLPIDQIEPAPWNANEMDEAMRLRLRRSIERFGLVVPLVVRSIDDNRFETVGGAHRLAVLRDLGYTAVPCVVVAADDSEAGLLSQALNHIAGQDNAGLRGGVLRKVLEMIPQEDVLAILPNSEEALKSLCSLGQEDLAAHLRAHELQRAARLRHVVFHLTPDQLRVVEAALRRARLPARQADDGSPSLKGRALTLICAAFLEKEANHDQ